MTDPRRTIHIAAPMHQAVDGEPLGDADGHVTLVPCFECSGQGLVSAERRAEQRARAGMPPSSLPADRHEKGTP